MNIKKNRDKMCGICGILSLNKATEKSLIVKMRDTMIHRGPDDFGIYLNSNAGQYAPSTRHYNVGLGHRRLSIIDLSPNGRQPMSNENGSIWLVCNGEIYNYRELKADLENRGHRFRSNSDNEVILHMYEECGIALVQQLRGIFAFAIWDSNKNKLFLARDRLGIKPLYYTQDSSHFIFASEIKAILASELIQPSLNRHALYQYLYFGKAMPPLTLFDRIYKLAPGHIISLEIQPTSYRLHSNKYWDIFDDVKPQKENNEVFYIEEITNRLRESVKYELMSDVPVGVFLSGGVDSSLVTALVAETEDVPLKTFTLGFKDYEGYNEFAYARKVADFLKSKHNEVVISGREIIDFFPKFLDYQEEPVSNPIWIAIYFVAKLAKDNGVKVVLSGDGGDELFVGYNRWRQYLKFYNYFWRYYEKTPRLLRQLNYYTFRPILNNRAYQDLFRRTAANEELFQGGNLFRKNELKSLLSKEYLKELEENNPYEIIAQFKQLFKKNAPNNDYGTWMSYISLKTGLLEDYLMRLDKMAMAASVEGRVPLLDHKFLSYTFSIPPRLKYKNYENKYLLKRVCAKLLPADFVYRHKMGFCAPLEDWLLSEMKEFQLAALEYLEFIPIFDKKKIKKSAKNFAAGTIDAFSLYALVNLGLWYKKWFFV